MYRCRPPTNAAASQNLIVLHNREPHSAAAALTVERQGQSRPNRADAAWFDFQKKFDFLPQFSYRQPHLSGALQTCRVFSYFPTLIEGRILVAQEVTIAAGPGVATPKQGGRGITLSG
jgi:hypothetical protein